MLEGKEFQITDKPTSPDTADNKTNYTRDLRIGHLHANRISNRALRFEFESNL